jgi:LmbE family N-acetylglucosaminyl deacetylase
MTSSGRLLIVYAHPDDEAFGLGALIAKSVDRGIDVYLICATNGERGTVKPEFLADGRTVKAVRLAELEAAAKILRLRKVYLLDYKDSGMMGTPDTQDPECLWQAPLEEVTRKVVAIMREVKPHVVITFNRYGGYGHPDHIKIQQAATQAFTLAGDAAYETGLPPYPPQKLYYTNVSRWQLRLGVWMTRLRGDDPRRLGRNHDIDLVRILDHIEPIHAAVDIRDYYPAWDAASAAHASQLGGRTPRIPKRWRRYLAPRQGFTRVYPPPNGRGIDEHDLFQGVQYDEAAPVTPAEAVPVR